MIKAGIICVSGGICSCLAMLLSTQSVNVAMLMATYGLAGGFGMGLVYLESIFTFYRICSHKKGKKFKLPTCILYLHYVFQFKYLLTSSVSYTPQPSVCVVGYYFEKKRALATGYTLLSFSPLLI